MLGHGPRCLPAPDRAVAAAALACRESVSQGVSHCGSVCDPACVPVCVLVMASVDISLLTP